VPGRPTTAASALPDLSLSCLGAADGAAAVPLRRLTGRPMVINLWASWCGPCRAELPALARLSKDAGARLRVLGVASLDVPGNSLSFAADNALPFPSLQDIDGDLGRDLRKRGLPVTVLVKADGSVADVYQGQPLTDATLRALVRDMLGIDV
jgi:thiol-disulfide isomerase/thioredoxin